MPNTKVLIQVNEETTSTPKTYKATTEGGSQFFFHCEILPKELADTIPYIKKGVILFLSPLEVEAIKSNRTTKIKALPKEMVKEAFAELELERKKKPPIGIEPQKFVLERRFKELDLAIKRYYNAAVAIPLEWIEEYNHLLSIVKIDREAVNEVDTINELVELIHTITVPEEPTMMWHHYVLAAQKLYPKNVLKASEEGEHEFKLLEPIIMTRNEEKDFVNFGADSGVTALQIVEHFSKPARKKVVIGDNVVYAENVGHNPATDANIINRWHLFQKEDSVEAFGELIKLNNGLFEIEISGFRHKYNKVNDVAFI